MITTFAFVTFAWIFFRCPDLKSSLQYLQRLLTRFNNPGQTLLFVPMFLYIIPLVIIDWLMRRDERKLRVLTKANYWVYILMMEMIIVCLLQEQETKFIYFQF
jgi:hypothetical protein